MATSGGGGSSVGGANGSMAGGGGVVSPGIYPSASELIHAILHGNLNKAFPEPPPRLVKIFVSSTKTDFECERQQLHEVVVPKLERYCNAHSLDLLVIDPHWQQQPCSNTTSATVNSSTAASKPDVICCNGATNSATNSGSPSPAHKSPNPNTVTPVIYDHASNCINPHEFELQLLEVEQCAQQSVATFFMCLIGHKYRPIALPTVIASEDFQQIYSAAAESGLGDVNLLRTCYKENRNLQPAPQYVLLEPRRASRQYEEELEHIAKLVEYGSRIAAREGLLSHHFGTVMSAVHQQTLHALHWARLVQHGASHSSPTLKHFPNSGHSGANCLQAQQPSHAKLQRLSPSKSATKILGSPMHNMPHSPLHHQVDSATPTSPCRSGRLRSGGLRHQSSLQQVPTQQRIAMPRQTSVTTNYALLQPPVDRMLCFIRQLEGVNFNNACVTRFFDVTPTTLSNQGDSSTQSTDPPLSMSSSSSMTPPPLLATSATGHAQSTKQLYAPAAQSDIQQLIEDVILGLKKGNVHYFNISWSPPEANASMQTRTYTLPEHYLERFGETVLRTLQSSLDDHIVQYQQGPLGSLLPGATTLGSPEYPGDIVREAHSHLCNFRRVMGALGMAQAIDSDFAHLLHIRELLSNRKVDEATSNAGSRSTTGRHQPIVVTGREGTGKSTLLAQVFTYSPEWLAENSERPVIRIVRGCGQSPGSSFASELLRSLCVQISITYGLEQHLSRAVAAHELSELAICFQEVLKLRTRNACDLLIILDDLHHLHQSALQSSALLGWMPFNLPSNVHFICSVASESESVLSVLRSRIQPENFVRLGEDAHLSAEPEAQMRHSHSIFSMIQCKLRDEKRTLTGMQWEFVRQKLKVNKVQSQFQQQQHAQPKPEIQAPPDVILAPTRPDSIGITVSPENATPLYANLLASAVLSTWESFLVPDSLPVSVGDIVTVILDDVEECIPYVLVRRICTYLSCTKYGFRESELYNLVQETLMCQVWNVQSSSVSSSTLLPCSDLSTQSSTTPDPCDYPRSTASMWLLFKYKMKHLWREYYVLGQLYYQWRSAQVARAVRERYLADVRATRAVHHELATAFYSSFNELSVGGKEIESVREADELWYHLLHAGAREQLKSYALLNARFVSTVVRSVSVCFLRCVLDAVRSQLLDWDVEQLYAMLKQSSHVVSQDPAQLPVEALLWLVPFASPGTLALSQLVSGKAKHVTSASNASSHLGEFLKEAYRTCVDYAGALLYPVNIWLNLPVPPQLITITSPWASITRAVNTPDSQHLIVCEGRSLHFYHLPTKSIAKSLEGHKSTITCVFLSSSGRYLATGAEDYTVHLWQVDASLMEVNDCRIKHRFCHHSSGVLCVTINHSESLILSGSEAGAICVVALQSGALITRLEHHRGMVTCMGVNPGDDVLVSGSTDRTVLIWSLDTFQILNEIILPRPVLHMDISLDSTFLLLSLDDNSLQLRALTTGTGVHTLQPASVVSGSTVVSYVKFAEDNCRAVVGYADGRLLVFDIHSARQLQSLTAHSEMISAILPQKDDHFLITCGGNKIVIWNFFPVKRVDQALDSTTLAAAVEKSIFEINLEGLPTSGSVSSDPETGATSGIGSTVSGTSVERDRGGSTGSAAGTGSSSGTTTGGGGRSSRSSSDRRKHKPSTSGSFRKKTGSVASIDPHRDAITCVAVSRDGQYVVTGGRDHVVKIWYAFSGETHSTLDEEQSPISCVDIAANSTLVVSGTEEGHLHVWSLTLSMYLCKFTEHQGVPLCVVKILSDCKRVLSADHNFIHRLWQADNGVQLKCIVNKPTVELHLHGSTAFAIGGKIDNCLKYWSVFEPETERTVSHSDTITCFACTHSGRTIITGAQDMSLKVWEAATAKLTQVLVGHEGPITCVASAALDETLVVSGAQDCNLIVWDMNTGAELFTLTGHQASVMGVVMTPDAARALSYSEDNTLQLWDIRDSGQRLSILDLHHNFTSVYTSLNMSTIAVWLGANSHILPLIRHHNNPAHSVTVDLPPVGTPVTTTHQVEEKSAWLRGLVSNRNRTLKREQSFDSFYFDHMLHRGQSVDDFRKIAGFQALQHQQQREQSPFGSREQLWTDAAHAQSGSAQTSQSSSSSSTRSRMISKLMNMGPKQKMLKKQQSMFACFPEFTGKAATTSSGATTCVASLVTESSISANGSIGKKIHGSTTSSVGIKKFPGPTSLTHKTTPTTPAPARSSSVEESDDSSGHHAHAQIDSTLAKAAATTALQITTIADSSVCVIT